MGGFLPSELGALTALQGFSVFLNDMSGTLPSSIAQWTNLMFFDVESNLLTGSAFPPAFSAWSDIMVLRISNNFFSGTIMNDLSMFSNLGQFWAAQNNIEGTIPQSVGKLTNLGKGQAQLAFWRSYLSHISKQNRSFCTATSWLGQFQPRSEWRTLCHCCCTTTH